MHKAPVPFWVKHSNTIIPWFYLLGFLLAGGIICYQVYYWLRDGEWIKMPLEKAFDFLQLPFFSDPYSWYHNPDSWVGINKIIVGFCQYMPLSVFCFGACWIVARCWEESAKDYLKANAKSE